MAGISNLDTLLKDMEPILCKNEYVFCTTNGKLNESIISLDPIGIIQEKEGLTLILLKNVAHENGFLFDGVYRKISLNVHSDLEAVGLTAAFANALTDNNISANVIAGYYHDHIFVPAAKAEDAMNALNGLSLLHSK